MMNQNDKEIGQKVKQLREKNNLSQKDLAEKLGYQSDTAIHLIEKGKRSLSVEKLKELAEIFNVSASVLIDDKVYSKDVDIKTALRTDSRLNEKDIDQISDFIEFIKQKTKE